VVAALPPAARGPSPADHRFGAARSRPQGDPESPLRWTSKSLNKLADELTAQGHPVSDDTVRRLLAEQGFSLQANAKTLEGSRHADRDAQFHHINEQVKAALAAGEPVISVDTKKKELIGAYKNGGREYRPAGVPEQVNVHDFIDKQLGKAVPYGVYDVGANTGWVSVGVDHDTASFAVNSIRTWWEPGRQGRLPGSDPAVDHRGLRRVQRQPGPAVEDRTRRPAAETGLTIKVCHPRRAPPNGTGSSTSCSASSR
jgi:hypothetical protein